MDPDNYQQAWQAQASQTRVKIYADLLLKEVQSDQRNYEAEIFRGKCLAVGMVLLSLPLWLYVCAVWYMAVPVIVWVTVMEIVFIRECRNRFSHHSQKANEPGEPLLHCVKESLNQVEREIREARHVFWWVVVPASLSFLALMVAFGLRSPAGVLSFALVDVRGIVVDLGGVFVVLPALMYFINHLGVRVRLERREKLLTLLTSLRDETNSEVGRLPFPAATGTGSVITNPAPVAVPRSKFPKSQGTQPMNKKRLIEITLVVLFLAANIGILYLFRGRFSGNLTSPQNLTFADATKRGLDAFESGNFDQAIVAWDEAIRLDPKNSEIHRWRGDASLNKHEYDKALPEYDEAIRLDPYNGMAYSSRGAAWALKGESDKAIASFDEAIRIDPKIADRSFYKRYRLVAESLRQNPQNPKFAAAAERGSNAFRRRNFDEAIAAWDEAIRLDPNHSEIHRWRGDASLNKHDYDKALSEYDEAIRLDPKNGMAYCCRGAAWTEKGESGKAIAAFDEAIRIDPEIVNQSFYKRYRAAAKSLPSNSQSPKFADAAKRGFDAFASGNFDQASAAWDEAIQLDPTHSEAHRWRGDASLNKHEFDKALSEYEEAIRLDPKNGMAYLCRGAAWTEKGESDKAIDSFDEAIRIDPKIANMPVYKRYRGAAESLPAVKPISPEK